MKKITAHRFFRNINEHMRFVPFLTIMGMFTGMVAVHVTIHEFKNAVGWLLGGLATLCIAGCATIDDDDDPQHPVPGWDLRRPFRPHAGHDCDGGCDGIPTHGHGGVA